jgi:CubicO group peptidase (beta-lactamase class C family)
MFLAAPAKYAARSVSRQQSLAGARAPKMSEGPTDRRPEFPMSRLQQALVLAALIVCTAFTGCSRPRHSGDAPALLGTPAVDLVVRGPRGARLDGYLTRASAFGFSGTVLVADSSQIVLHKGYGLADPGAGVPNTTRTVYDMGSITKQFTAAAILLLEADGRLATSDTLGRHLPAVPPDKAAITLHQVMTHTAGLVDLTGDDYDVVPRDSAVRDILREPLRARPGERFLYSNAGFTLLAAIVERVSGQPYERFLRERLLAPVGMSQTGYRLPRWDSARVAHTYTPPVDHGTPLQRFLRNDGPHWILLGNGGMLTTTGDLYRWERGLAAGRPLPRAVQGKQFAPQFVRSPTLAQGYDWWIEVLDGERVLHRGGDGPPTGVNADYRRYPDGSVIILLANTRHNGGSTRRFVVPRLRRILTGGAAPQLPEIRSTAPPELQRYAGRYVLDSVSRFRVTVDRDRLVFSAEGQRAVNLLNFNRDSTSLANRAAANARASTFIDALARGSLDGLLRYFPDSAAARRMAGYWRDAEARHGAFIRAEVLGTTRLDRGQFLTTVRLSFARDTVPVRFAWAGDRPVVNSEDGYLPRFAGPVRYSPVDAGVWSPYWWRETGDSFVTYDLFFDQPLRAEFRAGPSGMMETLAVQAPSGAVVARRE